MADKPVHRKMPSVKMRVAKVAESLSDADSQFSIDRLIDLENNVWELQEDMMKLCDEVESMEPLQAKQTFNIIADRIGAIGEYINSLPEPTK